MLVSPVPRRVTDHGRLRKKKAVPEVFLGQSLYDAD